MTVISIADKYTANELYSLCFGTHKLWPHPKPIHLIHNWRTGGSSLSALLSLNFHSSYLKVGHPFTRSGWPVDYSCHPTQITTLKSISEHSTSQSYEHIILAGHTYNGLFDLLGVHDYDTWITIRDPAARFSSGILRFYTKPLISDHPDGGYVGKAKKHFSFSSLSEVKEVIDTHLLHEVNGHIRRICGYSLSNEPPSSHNIESYDPLDCLTINRQHLDHAISIIDESACLFLTDDLLLSILNLESTYGLKPVLHPASTLVHNKQGLGGLSRQDVSLLPKYRTYLESVNSLDMRLYDYSYKKFWSTVKQFSYDPDYIYARRLIQKYPIFNPNHLPQTSLELTSTVEKYLLAIYRLSKRTDKHFYTLIEGILTEAFFWAHPPYLSQNVAF